MKTLNALCKLPFITASGEIISTPGFHDETGIYADFDHGALAPVPDAPSGVEIVGALQTAMLPWSRYRFAATEDRGAMLAAVITAICRPALPTCPAFFFDSPIQASGKTKCATALGGLTKGHLAGVTTFVSGPNAEPELVKKLVSMSLAGESFCLIDNVVGIWRSPVLAALITEGQINERILGANQWYRGASRMLVTATGNNASLDLDLGRRFIRIRIDPACETPQAREFSFDPVDIALSTRLAISHAVLVLVQAYQSAGSPSIGRGDGGFAEWNRLVRRCVLWLQAEGYAEEAGLGVLGDPACSILESASAEDPDTESTRMLLLSLDETFKGEAFTAREIYALYTSGRGEVFEALHCILGGRRDVTPVGIGRVLRNRRDKIVSALALRSVGEDRSGTRWMVVSC